jgi:hypothetical protein
MALTNQQLEQLALVAKMPEGNIVSELLTMRLAEYDKALRSASGEEILRSQGRAQAVEQLIKDFAEAGERLRRAAPTRLKVPDQGGYRY